MDPHRDYRLHRDLPHYFQNDHFTEGEVTPEFPRQDDYYLRQRLSGEDDLDEDESSHSFEHTWTPQKEDSPRRVPRLRSVSTSGLLHLKEQLESLAVRDTCSSESLRNGISKEAGVSKHERCYLKEEKGKKGARSVFKKLIRASKEALTQCESFEDDASFTAHNLHSPSMRRKTEDQSYPDRIVTPYPGRRKTSLPTT